MSAPNSAAPVQVDTMPEQTVADWARNSVEVRYLRTFRKLSPERQEAWLRAGRRMADGMPVHEAALLAYRECGMSEAEVAEAMAGLPTQAEEA